MHINSQTPLIFFERFDLNHIWVSVVNQVYLVNQISQVNHYAREKPKVGVLLELWHHQAQMRTTLSHFRIFQKLNNFYNLRQMFATTSLFVSIVSISSSLLYSARLSNQISNIYQHTVVISYVLNNAIKRVK